MNIFGWVKNLGVMALVVGLAVGCASTPPPETDEAEAQAAAAIVSAQSAIEEAAALGAEWRDAQSVLDEAKVAFEAGDFATAIELANKAEAMARQAIADAQVVTEEEAAPSSGSYEVVSGDNLWNIAGSSSVYGDPFQWPLIYKANKSIITDADLIEPGQVLSYELSPSASDVSTAVNHAKTRGKWVIGVVEVADEHYLSGSN